MSDSRLEMFGNRLKKRFKHQARWAKREEISCFRIYDRDIPQVPVTVDWFEGTVVASLFFREGDEKWTGDLPSVISTVLNVPAGDVFFRIREKQKGAAQYQRLGGQGTSKVVTEGGFAFRVRFGEYLDAGLFLDHRRTRAMVGAEAKGKRFLNLFSYTSSFSVYAAMNGATSSVSVDMSNRNTDWSRENFGLNQITEPEHAVVRADVMTFLREYRGKAFQLVVVDPPTFSNSAKMEGSFDVQRDHGELLHGVSRITEPGAVIFFSSNRRGFKLDEEHLSQWYEISEITEQTQPVDFVHRPHKCFRLVRVA